MTVNPRVHLVQAVVIAMVIASSSLLGCNNQTQGGPNTPVGTSSFAPIVIPKDSLPIGDDLPPLEDGIRLADPKGWKRFPKARGYLARFFLNGSNDPPRIIVKVGDCQFEGINNIADDAQHEALVKAIDADLGASVSLLEAPLAVTINGVRYVRYVKTAQLRSIPAESQFLVTVINGRQYEIDLQVKSKTIQDYKTAGYAVAATLRLAADDNPAEKQSPPGTDAGKNTPGKKNAGKKPAPPKK